jgi:2-oxoglutarate ferredoxin oxidoreductase subunit delta
MKVYGRSPVNLGNLTLPHGQINLIIERCKGCRICIQFCPRDVLRESARMNLKGYHYPEVIPGKEDACVHCDFCTMVCPEFAIFTLEAAR